MSLEVVDRLLSRPESMPLVPRALYDPSLTATIDAADTTDLVRAGLYLLNDDLERAHAIAQRLEGNSTADYWHAIVHRREGDYGNSKYWFARAGDHPVLGEVYGSTTTASMFVDRCRLIDGGADAEAEEFQLKEIRALLAYAQSL